MAVASGASGDYMGIISGYGSSQFLYNTLTFTAPSLSLSGTTLTVNVGKLSGNNSWHDGSTNGSVNVPTKVYYIGK